VEGVVAVVPDDKIRPYVAYFLRTSANANGQEPEDFDAYDLGGIAAGIRASSDDPTLLQAADAIANLQELEDDDVQYLESIGASVALANARTSPNDPNNTTPKPAAKPKAAAKQPAAAPTPQTDAAA
jgi:hypothetical protein